MTVDQYMGIGYKIRGDNYLEKNSEESLKAAKETEKSPECRYMKYFGLTGLYSSVLNILIYALLIVLHHCLVFHFKSYLKINILLCR